MSLGLFLENLGLKRLESDTPDEVNVGGGHGAPIYEHGQQTRMRRAPIRAIAAMTWPEGPERVYGRMENVSPDGCLVKTEATLEAGTEIDIEITVAGTDPRLEVETTGTVRHVTEFDGRKAYGIEFDEISAENRKELKRLYNQAAG